MLKLLKAEKKIRNKELKQTSAPSSSRSYEKALLTSPNSSYLWIKYSAFLLDTFGLEKSREALQKALKTINSSEERERLNISIALMNLEFSYGSSETFENATSQALFSNNPEKILIHKAKKHLQANSFQQAEETLKILCRKYSKNIENWENLLVFYIKHQKDEEKFQEILNRGLSSLKNPIELKKKAAVLEYTSGSIEKGRTILENLIVEKPKRSDIWAIYLNLEQKHNSVEQIRDLYERALSNKASQKTISNFAKQYYNYELSRNNKERANDIANRFNLNN